MMTPSGNDLSSGRARELALQAWRTWSLFGSRSRKESGARRDDEDDDDDLPRPNAVVALLPLLRFTVPPLPA